MILKQMHDWLIRLGDLLTIRKSFSSWSEFLNMRRTYQETFCFNFWDYWYSSEKFGRWKQDKPYIVYQEKRNTLLDDALFMETWGGGTTMYAHYDEQSEKEMYFNFSAAAIESKFKIGYGYTEVKFTCNQTNGMHICPLWLWAEDETGSYEIDGMEIYFNEGKPFWATTAFHWWLPSGHSQKTQKHRLEDPFCPYINNVVGIERTEDRVRWWWNNKLVRQLHVKTPRKSVIKINTGVQHREADGHGFMQINEISHYEAI